ncbi:MAG TPA: condensation domain-containing protein [Mycobacteriales bacterium]|nr:condensation domain-containing protein [Mycobacteriales bacterium]
MTDRGSAPTRPTLPALLAASAAERPEQVALLLGGSRPLTLGEWQGRSGQVARRLSSLGIEPGDRVGLLFGGDGWIEYAIGYCAVLAAGAVAVPLPDHLPDAGLRERLDHCSATALLHGGGPDVSGLDLPAATVPDLEDDPAPPGPSCSAGPSGSCGPCDPDGLAEIRYLSGRGTPRGVAASHAEIVVGVSRLGTEPPFDRTARVLCCCPVGAPAGQWLLARALIGRGAVLMVPRFTPDQVGNLIESHRASSVLLAPDLATDLPDAGIHLTYDLSSVRWAGSVGAALLPAGVEALRTVFPDATLIDHCGSTGPIPVAARMVVDPGRPGSVGRPMDGTELMITGEDGVPLPTGRVGEVLARPPVPVRGYYPGGPGRFLGPAPATGPGGPARAWVPIGDLGYLDADGYLHLVRRPADVIRSGGLKVSTPRVEAALAEHPDVTEAAVVGVGHPVVGATVAAAVALRHDVPPAELRDFLRDGLADHELPSRILVVDALPRDGTAVAADRVRGLLAAAGNAPRIAPTSPVELALAEQWTEVLGTPVVGVDDDFFALGGDSLKAALLAARAELTFGVRASASLVFDVPVFAHQAGWLESRLPSEFRPAPTDRPNPPAPSAGPMRPMAGSTRESVEGSTATPVETVTGPPTGSMTAPLTGSPTGSPTMGPVLGSVEGVVSGAVGSTIPSARVALSAPVSPATSTPARSDSEPEERAVVRVPLSSYQERSLMWMFGGTRPRRLLPMVASMRIAERLDLRTMRRSLNEVAYRQEALRTVFAPMAGRYEAIMLPDCLPNFVSIRARGATLAEREEHARRLAREYVERPFDIVRGPLFRALVIQLGDEDNVLVLSLDRLVSDGLSTEVLLDELGVIYAAFRAGERSPLPPVALRCSDFLAWVRQQYDHTRGYWERALAGAPAAVGPLPGQNTAARTYSVCRYEFAVPAGLGDRLRGTYAEHGVTAFMASIAAWSGVLSSWTGLPEIVLSSPMSGRTRPEFESLVGSILQSPFFRLRTTGDPTFGELFTQARRSVVDATEHQFYPHHEFLSQVPYPAQVYVDDCARPCRLPGLDCQPFGFAATLLPDRRLEENETDLHIPCLGLSSQPNGSISGTLTYNRYAFERRVVERLADDFLRFTGAALADSHRRLSDLSVSAG